LIFNFFLNFLFKFSIKRTHFNCAKIPLELILDSPLNVNFFNDQNLIDHLKTFKSLEITYVNNTKIWTSQKKEELYKMCLKLNKSLKCFYQCDDCIIRNSIECCYDHIILKVKFSFFLKQKSFFL